MSIRGLGFVNSSQKQNNLKDAPLFHRVKRLVIHFTDKYVGGLGRSRSLYTDQKFEITLKDKPGLQVVYFYKTIHCNGLKLEIKDIYPGLVNEIRLNEVVFYLKK